jgi:transposase
LANDQGNRLLRIVRRCSGSVATWRRAQIVLLSAQGMAWSLSKLAEFLVAEGVVDDISHEGLRDLLRKEGVRFQVIKTWKTSTDPDYEAKKNRVLELYDVADGKTAPGDGDPQIVFCMDEFGPLSLLPRPGKQWAPAATKAAKGSDRAPRRRRRRATYTHAQGVRHLMAALNLMTDHMFGHVKTNKNRTTFLAFCRYLRSIYPPEVRIAIVMDNFSPHLSTKKDQRVGNWATKNNVELAYVPTSASWLNRIECQLSASSPRCATSRSTGPIIAPTRSRTR